MQGYDYTQPGAYFVTLASARDKTTFGDIFNGVPDLNPLGQIARECWLGIPDHFPHVLLDEFVIMPDHLHGILIMTQPDTAAAGATHASPLRLSSGWPRGPQANSLGSIIGSYKSAVSRQAHLIPAYHDLIIWQRNYYERIIQDESELNATRKYIRENPLRWQYDLENPVG